MTIDRHGDPLRLFWAPDEDEWAKAARSLRPVERLAAYRDISAMTGRTIDSIQRRAGLLLARERQANKEWLATHMRKNWLSGAPVEPPRRVLAKVPTLTRMKAVTLAGRAKQG